MADSVFRWVVGCALALAVLSAVAWTLRAQRGEEDALAHYAIRLFDMDGEQSIPNWFGGAVILANALLAAAVWRARRREGAREQWGWLLIAAAMMFVAMDEAVAIHEKLGLLLRERFGFRGALFNAWILPYGIAAALLGLALLRFLRSLPAATCAAYCLSAGVFVAGAVGCDIAGGFFEGRIESPATAALIHLEEVLEIVGAAIFLRATLVYMKQFRIAIPD